jgi:RNA polymerase sigma factor (sigma-70 family)
MTTTTDFIATTLDWAQLDATVRQTLRTPSLQSSISLLTHKGDSVDDLAQTALMKLFEHLPQFDASKSSIETYAAKHARQAVTDRLRYWSQPKRRINTAVLSLQHEYERGNTLDDALPTVFDDYFSDMTVKRAVNTVDRELGGKCSQVFDLLHLQERTQAEVAQVIGVSQMHVSRLAKRTFSVLRREFSEVSV